MQTTTLQESKSSQDFALSIDKYQDDEEEEYNEQNADDKMKNTIKVAHGEKMTWRERIHWFKNSQLFVHMLMVGNLLLFGGFCVLNPISLQFIHPVVSCCLRVLIMTISMLPLAIIVDWKYEFRQVSDSMDLHPVLRFLLKKIPEKENALLLVLCGALSISNMLLYSLGTGLTSPTIAGILQPCVTVFTCLISIALKREGRSFLKIIGVGVAVAGTVLMFVISGIVHKTGNPFSVIGFTSKGIGGYLLLVTSFLCLAFFIVVQKQLLDRKVPPFTLSVWSLVFASIIAAIVSLFFVQDIEPAKITRVAWIGLIYSSLAYGTISYLMVAYASRLTSPTVISVYYTPFPLVSMIFLYVFLKQTTTWFALFGAALITIGVVMVGFAKQRENLREQRKKELIAAQLPMESVESVPADETKGTDRDSLELEEVDLNTSERH